MLCVTVNDFAATSNSNQPENRVPRHRRASLLAHAVYAFFIKAERIYGVALVWTAGTVVPRLPFSPVHVLVADSL
jgi:hypothetical protein